MQRVNAALTTFDNTRQYTTRVKPMPNTDPRILRPLLVNSSGVANAVQELKPKVSSTAEMWRLLTERFVVDLDAVASLLPSDEPETFWLPARA
jgi:hypothetical protein